ncbi:MAG: dTDP-4-dehydrorhamnose reductase [Phycisphaerales bacterium]|nr:dTDP-4-dehydrorhamnose reductase [Phycisphaerales bacterium]
MKCLITGAGGQLAMELVRHAPGLAELHALDIETLDITVRQQVMDQVSAIRPDVVFNAAAWTDVDGAESNESSAAAVNDNGASHLAQACGEFGARLVHVSTDFVFDGNSDTPYKVDDPTNPLCAYGRTKLAGEQVVLKTLGESAMVVRTAWLYSAHGKNFLRTMLDLMSKRDQLSVVADQRGTPTSAGSLARALWDLLQEKASGTYHWTDGGEATWHEFAVGIHDAAREKGLLDRDVTIDPIPGKDWPAPAKRPSYSVLDMSRTEAMIGRTPRHWQEEVRIVIDELATAAAGDHGG